jgi:hypothetical protein
MGDEVVLVQALDEGLAEGLVLAQEEVHQLIVEMVYYKDQMII